MTKAQNARNAARRNGKFKAHKCERCGKGAPMDHFGDERGWTILCEKCADKCADMSDAEFSADKASR